MSPKRKSVDPSSQTLCPASCAGHKEKNFEKIFDPGILWNRNVLLGIQRRRCLAFSGRFLVHRFGLFCGFWFSE